MAEIYSSGQDLRNIKNRAYTKFETDKAEKMIIALDKSGVPYFARFDSESISVTYDSDYKKAVEEIAAKILSGDCENNDTPETILREIADILKVSISFLKSRPDEFSDILRKTYVDFRYCDSVTISRKLWEIIKMNGLSEIERSL